MPEMSRYDNGVPSWVDMSTPDLEASVAFYTRFFGWRSQDMGREVGHYTMLFKAGKEVAAIMPAQGPEPAYWSTWVNVDDVEPVAKSVEEAGGTIVVPPTEVMTAGRMAVFADSTGARVGAWQPGDHIGCRLVNEPGALIWNELETSDLAKSKAFYGAVFGWGWGGSTEYAEAQVAGRTIGGVQPRPTGIPAEAPDFWQVYFGSADVDVDVTKAVELGATVLMSPRDIPSGRFAVLADPHGAVFALFSA